MRSLSSTISVALLGAALAGCSLSGSAERPPLARSIGAPPAYLQPVKTPAWQEGESAYLVAEREARAGDKRNAIIACARAEWLAVEAALAAGRERPRLADWSSCVTRRMKGK